MASRSRRMAMPFDPRPLPHKAVIASDLHAARRLEDRIIAETDALGYGQQCAFAIRLALEEAMVNAHKHGNRNDPNKRIIINYDVNARQTVIRIRDEGGGFDPNLVPDPTAPDRVSLPNGRGIMLMRAYVDQVAFNDRGNEVQLVKERS